jgi:hypothetical protein
MTASTNVSNVCRKVTVYAPMIDENISVLTSFSPTLSLTWCVGVMLNNSICQVSRPSFDRLLRRRQEVHQIDNEFRRKTISCDVNIGLRFDSNGKLVLAVFFFFFFYASEYLIATSPSINRWNN